MKQEMRGLKCLLVARGIKLSDLSRQTDISYHTLLANSNGYSTPSDENLKIIAGYLGVESRDLFYPPLKHGVVPQQPEQVS